MQDISLNAQAVSRLPERIGHIGAVNAQGHVETIRRINTTFFMAVRDAARENVPYAVAAFGVSRALAEWMAAADIDALLDLAAMPVCVFSVRVPDRAITKSDRGSSRSRTAGNPSVVALHTALAGLRQE